jgi:hypothetical protein
VTRARDIADQQDNLGGAVPPVVSGKNFIINGSMDISQRGTAFTGVNSVYTLDRWFYASFGTSTTANVSQGTADSVPGFQYYARIAANAATLSNYNLTQTLETANTIPLRGRTVTVSFWLRTPVAFSNIFVWNLRYSTSADTRISNAGTGTAVGSDFTFTGPTAWTKYSQTMTIPSDASSLGLVIGTYNNTVSTAYFDIAGVQLELGSQVTPFARAGGSIGGELALCQRYYWRAYGNAANMNWSLGQVVASGYSITALQNPIQMRVPATSIDWSGAISFYDPIAAVNYDATTVTTLDNTSRTSIVRFNTSSLSNVGRVGYLNGGSTQYIGFSAEL